jgi:hypothetical protein
MQRQESRPLPLDDQHAVALQLVDDSCAGLGCGRVGVMPRRIWRASRHGTVQMILLRLGRGELVDGAYGDVDEVCLGRGEAGEAGAAARVVPGDFQSELVQARERGRVRAASDRWCPSPSKA